MSRETAVAPERGSRWAGGLKPGDRWAYDAELNVVYDVGSNLMVARSSPAGNPQEIADDFRAIGPAIAAAPELAERGHSLAMLALQSERYARDPDYREAVDNMLAALAKAGVS